MADGKLLPRPQFAAVRTILNPTGAGMRQQSATPIPVGAGPYHIPLNGNPVPYLQ